MKYKFNQNGFIALFSVIIISLVLEGLVLSSTTDITNLQNSVLMYENKEQSFYNSLSCIHEAQLIVATTQNIIINEKKLIMKYDCSITATALTNKEITFTVTAQVQTSLTTQQVVINKNDLSFTSSEIFI